MIRRNIMRFCAGTKPPQAGVPPPSVTTVVTAVPPLKKPKPAEKSEAEKVAAATMGTVSQMKVQIIKEAAAATPTAPVINGIPTSPFVNNGPTNPFSETNISASLAEAHKENFKKLKELRDINEPEAPALNAAIPSGADGASPLPLHGMKLKRFFRFDQAFSEKKSKDDIILATEENNHGTFTFNTFSGVTTKDQLAEALLSIPPHLRRYHCVTGVLGHPIDFYADLDIPKDLSRLIPHEKLLKMVINITHSKLKDIKLSHKDTLVLESPGSKHLSFHLHIRCSNGVFEDFSVIRPLADEVNAEFARQVKAVYDKKEAAVPEELATFSPLDTAVYRRCGQVRLGHCVKIARPDAPLTLYKPQDEGLKKLMESTMNMSIKEHIALSIPLRLSTEDYGITIKAGKTHSVDGAGIGRKIPPRMHESKKADRFRDCCAQIKKYPIEFSRDYNQWVCVGCALYSFGPEFREQALDVWMGFSRRCGEKFKPTAIRRYWDHSFRGGVNGTAIDDNWRRGYYYLVSTIYGQSLSKNKVKQPGAPGAAPQQSVKMTTSVSAASTSKGGISEL